MERKVYRSRISVALIIIFVAMFSLPLIPMIRSGNIFNSASYSFVGIPALIVFIMTGIRYTITDKQLIISTWGTCKMSFMLSQILSVERSYNMLSSPAVSLKRLGIRFKKGSKYPWILISPVREQEFLDTLIKYNPDIYVRVENNTGWWRFWDWDV